MRRLVSRHTGDRRAQPDPAAARPDLLLGVHGPADHVRAAVHATCSAARSARPATRYIDFLIPGIIVQNIAFGGFVTALGLNEDVHKGLIDRFRSLPMARRGRARRPHGCADIVTNTSLLDDDVC